MSGGQKQRVASARAIVTNPSLVLADEPTGALDSKAATMLLESLEDLNKNLNATIMMVTHDALQQVMQIEFYLLRMERYLMNL